MSQKLALAVIGEVNLDISSTLKSLSFSGIQANKSVYTPIRSRLGGSGGSLAITALNYFSSVELVGCIGPDSIGSLLENELRTAGVITHLHRESTSATRMVILIHDQSNENNPGLRLLVTDDHSPSYWLAPTHIEDLRPVFLRCNLLIVSGYSFIREPSRSACLLAMQICTESSINVAVDIVPHEILGVLSLEDVHQITNNANFLIAELKTFRLLLKLPEPRKLLELKDAIESMPIIRNEFPNRWLLIRFGVGNIDQSLIVAPSGEARHAFTGYQLTSDVTGFGDKLTAHELYMLVSHGIDALPSDYASI